jgi:hypothetical protein
MQITVVPNIDCAQCIVGCLKELRRRGNIGICTVGAHHLQDFSVPIYVGVKVAVHRIRKPHSRGCRDQLAGILLENE